MQRKKSEHVLDYLYWCWLHAKLRNWIWSSMVLELEFYKKISITTCGGILLEPCPSTAHQNDYGNWVVVKKITRGKESNMKNTPHGQTEILSLPAKQEILEERPQWLIPVKQTVMTLGVYTHRKHRCCLYGQSCTVLRYPIRPLCTDGK